MCFVVWDIALFRRRRTFGSELNIFRINMQLLIFPKNQHYYTALSITSFTKKIDAQIIPYVQKIINGNFVSFCFSGAVSLFALYSIMDRLVSSLSLPFLDNLWHLNARDLDRIPFLDRFDIFTCWKFYHYALSTALGILCLFIMFGTP